MRFRRKLIGWIKSFFMLVLLIAFSVGGIYVGLNMPQIIETEIVSQTTLQIIGYLFILFIVVLLIAVWESLEHL